MNEIEQRSGHNHAKSEPDSDALNRIISTQRETIKRLQHQIFDYENMVNVQEARINKLEYFIGPSGLADLEYSAKTKKPSMCPDCRGGEKAATPLGSCKRCGGSGWIRE